MKLLTTLLFLIIPCFGFTQILAIGSYAEFSTSAHSPQIRLDVKAYATFGENILVLGVDYLERKVSYYVGIEQGGKKWMFGLGVTIPNHTREQEFPFGVTASVHRRFKRFRITANTGLIYNNLYANVGLQAKIVSWK